MPWAAHDDSLCIWLMPKTGSSFVEEVAASCIKGKRWQQQHDPAMLMLGDGIWAALRGARNYGTTRHPLTWYASLYRHACRWKLGTPTFKDWLLPRLNMPYEGIDAQYPGTIWQRATPSRNDASESHSFPPTAILRIWATIAGPPKAVNPSRKKDQKSS